MKNNKEKITDMLSKADVIYIGDSPILGSFPTEVEDGQLVFTWEDQEGEYEVVIPEESLETAEFFTGGDVQLKDANGEEATLQCYTLKQLKAWK